MTTVAVSGCFDPLHVGHLDLFERARMHGDLLLVIVDSDEYIFTKRRPLMPQSDRMRIVAALNAVHRVLPASGMDCCSVLRALRPLPDVFFVGADHDILTGDFPEFKTCIELGIAVRKAAERTPRSSTEMLLAQAKPRWVNPPMTVDGLLVHERRVLLIRRPDGELDLPGGFVEEDETLEAALRREVHEETGIFPLTSFYVRSHIGHYPADGRQVVTAAFRCPVTTGELQYLRPSAEAVGFEWTTKAVKLYSETSTAALKEHFG